MIALRNNIPNRKITLFVFILMPYISIFNPAHTNAVINFFSVKLLFASMKLFVINYEFSMTNYKPMPVEGCAVEKKVEGG